jgi:hypothetical protein
MCSSSILILTTGKPAYEQRITTLSFDLCRGSVNHERRSPASCGALSTARPAVHRSAAPGSPATVLVQAGSVHITADPSHIEALARNVGIQAETLRRQAQVLLTATTQVHWQSLAAQRFRDDIDHLAGQLRTGADQVDEVAATLQRHARGVSAGLEAVASAAAHVISAATPW